MSFFTLISTSLFWFNSALVIGPLVLYFFLFLKASRRLLFKRKTPPPEISIKIDEPVSVIIPFNGELELVHAAVKSIVEQTYQGPIKIFVASSNDLSYAQIQDIEAHSKQSREVELVFCEDSAKWFKLNRCIERSETNLIAFLDVDHIADHEWIADAVQKLLQNKSWAGVQCIRRPILRSGVVYAWDSFINHQGNEILNLVKSTLGFSVPFTGTTALFFKEKIKDTPFEASLTEDTAWYFKQIFSNEGFFIGYLSSRGSQELMSLSWEALLERRFRWARGHNKAFYQFARFSRPLTLARFVHLLHGIHYFVAVPLTLSVGIYFSFLFSQLFYPVKIFCFALAAILSWLAGKRVGFSGTRFSMRFVFFLIPIVMVIVWSTIFKSIWWSQFVSPYDLVALFGARLFESILLVSLGLFVFFSLLFRLRLIPWTYLIISIVAFPVLVFVEIMSAFLAVRPLETKNRIVWSTSRVRSLHFDYLFFTLLFLIYGLRTYDVLDERSPTRFLQDFSAYFVRPHAEKIPLNFSVIRGVAMNGKPSERLLKELSYSGARELRFYTDPGAEWVRLAGEAGFKIVLQPGFANWDGVDVRKTTDRKYLTIYSAYLDSKYSKSPNVLFMSIGNEIDLGFFFHQEKNPQRIQQSYRHFFTFFNEVIQDLSFGTYFWTVASPHVDTSKNDHLLMINTLNTDIDFWSNELANIPRSKIAIAGEWGGFRASQETPPDWLRAFRTELQWSYFKEHGIRGGFFFAAQDNPAQGSIVGYKDPYKSEPDDFRGLVDTAGNRKEIFWTISFLYTPLKLAKSPDGLELVNVGLEKLESVSILGTSWLNLNLDPGQSVSLEPQKLELDQDYQVSYRVTGDPILRTNILYHAQGRLTGCMTSVAKSLSGEPMSLISTSRDNFFIAEVNPKEQLKVEGAKAVFPGQIGLVEIQPTDDLIKLEGVTSVSQLHPCRKSFLLNR